MRGLAWLLLISLVAAAAPTAAAEGDECPPQELLGDLWPWPASNETDNETSDENGGGSAPFCGPQDTPPIDDTLLCRMWTADPGNSDPSQWVRVDPDQCVQEAVRDIIDGDPPHIRLPVRLGR